MDLELFRLMDGTLVLIENNKSTVLTRVDLTQRLLELGLTPAEVSDLLFEA
jgi:hypothetical protein